MSNSLKFTCPKCGKNRIESIEINATVSSEITNLDDGGDFDYKAPIVDESEVDRFQCVMCGYILKGEFGYNVNENDEAVEWLKENCKQE